MLEWAVISAAAAPHIKKYVTEKTAKLASGYADSAAAKLYKRLMPDQKLQKAVESFVAAFDKELRSTIQNPTLTGPAYPEALKIFLADYNVLEALEKPLDAQSELDWDLLKRRWSYLLDSKGQRLIDLPEEFDWDELASRYGKSLQKQALSDPELRQIAQTIATLQIKEDTKRGANATERLAGPAKGFDLVRYAQSIREAFGFLRFGSLDSDWTVYEGRVSLEHVYVPQSAKSALPPSDLTRDYLKELKTRGADVRLEMQSQKQHYEKLRSVPVREVVDDFANSRLVILGNPGLGKSTLLKYLALRWAREPSRPLALLLELRRSIHESGQIGFLDYLERGTGQTLPLPRAELDRYLKENQSLVLFDALDEVVEGQRGDVVLRIIAFAREYPKASIIVTTRIHGYHPGSTHPEQFRDAQFQQFTLQDFEPVEVDHFIDIWHKEAFQQASERTKYESRLRKALADSPAIRELSTNPLLLTMMAVLNRVQDLPRDRGRLYERCAELLLKNWDLEKFEELKERKEAQDIKDKLGPEQKMRILELVAAAMQQETTGLAGNIISEETLKEIIERQLTELDVAQPWSVAGDLIWMLRVRNFMLAYLGDRKYAFVHRTFLEYFCACDLKYRLEKTTTLSVDQLASLFSTKWPHDEWQEVLCLLSGMIGVEYAAKCISVLLMDKGASDGDKAVFLAAKCLLEIRELGSIRDVRAEVQNALFSLVKFDFPFVYKKHGHEAREVQRIRATAVRELARGWKDHPEILAWLKSRAVANNEDKDVREAAIQALARGWKDDPETFLWLKDPGFHYAPESVRAMVIHEVARDSNDPNILSWLADEASSASSGFVQNAAIHELLQGWPRDPTTLAILKKLVFYGATESVRQTAVYELARNWKGDPETPRTLKDRARHDENEYIRHVAAQELARGWPNDPEVTAVLQQQLNSGSSKE